MKLKHSSVKPFTSFACALTAVFGLIAESSAVTYNVITPVSASFVDDQGNYAGGNINNVINGSGVSSTIGTTIDTATIATLTVSGDIEGTGWRRNGTNQNNISFSFELDGPSDVSSILLANYLETGGPTQRGINSFTFQYSSDSGLSYTTFQTLNASQSTGGFQLIDLGTNLTGVTNIRFNNVTNFGADGTGNSNILGFNEVRFLNTVPEPSAALLGGLGILALLRRRRIS